MSDDPPIDLGHVKRTLLAAVADEHTVLHGYLDHLRGTPIDWSAGTRELWNLWQRELRGFKAPPPEPTPTGYDEARTALALFQRAVEELTDSPTPPTIYHHGEHSYSLGDSPSVVVTTEEHHALRAFAVAKRALDTKALEQHVSNPSRIMGQLDRKFPGAIRRPGHKGDGYHVRVEPA